MLGPRGVWISEIFETVLFLYKAEHSTAIIILGVRISDFQLYPRVSEEYKVIVCTFGMSIVQAFSP